MNTSARRHAPNFGEEKGSVEVCNKRVNAERAKRKTRDYLDFYVGRRVYRLRIGRDEPIYEGKPACAVIDPNSLEITMSPLVVKEHRLTLLFHELAHARIWKDGMPQDVEKLCDLVALCAADGMRCLEQQGGEQALLDMQRPRIKPKKQPASRR
ncbi:MAG TPA: hypothetical protein VFC78_15355 [Tepidisphaeraceae bacterium]|nr:hypothetical protein [Tepidisphaeraceae bacterium]